MSLLLLLNSERRGHISWVSLRLPPSEVIASSAYSNAVLADTPAAYWRLGETSGTVANSVIPPDSNDGTYIGLPTLGRPGALAGDNNTAVQLNGTSQKITVADTPALHLADGPLTLEAWVNLPTLTGLTQGIVSRGASGGYYLRINAAGQLEFVSSQVAIIVASTTTLSASAWHHVVATKNGAASLLYIDGVDVTGTVIDSTLSETGGTLSIGDEWPLGNTEWFGGSIDEVAIYNTVLSPARVLAHYLAGTSTATAPNTSDAAALVPAGCGCGCSGGHRLRV